MVVYVSIDIRHCLEPGGCLAVPGKCTMVSDTYRTDMGETVQVVRGSNMI